MSKKKEKPRAPCSPVIWYGGKGIIKKWILDHIADYSHNIYVEPYGGSASVLIAKEPVSVEVYNDLNGGIVDFFLVLADPGLFKRFQRIIIGLPHSRKMYYDFRSEYANEKDIVLRVAKWFYVARKSFSGRFGSSWGHCIEKSSRGMAFHSGTWLSLVEHLPEIHRRLQRVQIEHLPALTIIEKYDTPKTFFYLDPPYILDTRKGGKAYEHEMTNGDHESLVRKILGIRGSVCLSGYEHPIYQPLIDAGWTLEKRDVFCTASACGGKPGNKRATRKKRVECLYKSPVK